MRTYDLEPFVVHESHQRSAAVALTRVFAAHLVTRANHVLRDQVTRVIGLGALLVVDDRHVHLSQMTRRTSVLVQRTPTGRLRHAVAVRVVCKHYSYYIKLSSCYIVVCESSIIHNTSYLGIMCVLSSTSTEKRFLTSPGKDVFSTHANRTSMYY